MGRPRDDFDLLLEAPHPVEAELARGMLADAGIPVLMHGGDFDVAELGSATHAMLRRPDMYVPKGARARAEQVLRDAGYESQSRGPDDPGRPKRVRRWAIAWFVFWFAGIPAILALATCAPWRS
jgi:hypothetical protein